MVGELLSQFSLVSVGLSFAMIFFYLSHLVIPSASSILALVPGRAIIMPWTMITSGLFHQNVLGLLGSTAALLFLSRTVEAVQGQQEFLKFLLISLAGSGALTFILITMLYFFMVVPISIMGYGAGDRAGDMLYEPICGFQGGIAALLVGIKQAIPDNEVTLFSTLRFRAKDFPWIYVAIAAVGSLLTGTALQILPFVLFATYTSWFYLRFFACRSDSFLRGDPSEDFRFASLFPAVVQPAADVIARTCGAVTRFGIANTREAQSDRNSALLLGGGLPSRGDIEAARRRERGARALEERLGGLKKAVDPPGGEVQIPELVVAAAAGGGAENGGAHDSDEKPQ